MCSEHPISVLSGRQPATSIYADARAVLMTSSHSEGATLASFLPGICSALVRVVRYGDSKQGHVVIDAAVAALTATIVSTASDEAYTEAHPVQPQSPPSAATAATAPTDASLQLPSPSQGIQNMAHPWRPLECVRKLRQCWGTLPSHREEGGVLPPMRASRLTQPAISFVLTMLTMLTMLTILTLRTHCIIYHHCIQHQNNQRNCKCCKMQNGGP